MAGKKGDSALGGVNAFGIRSHAATAHFPGTGPAGTTCMDCRHIDREGKRSVCLKWGQLMTPKVPVNKIPGISPALDSCKYFEARPKAVSKAYKKRSQR